MKMIDSITGEEIEGTFEDKKELDEQTSFGIFTADDDGELAGYSMAYVVYHQSGIMFTTFDWQGTQPESVEEIPDYRWVDQDGNQAIILDGLPVLPLS